MKSVVYFVFLFETLSDWMVSYFCKWFQSSKCYIINSIAFVCHQLYIFICYTSAICFSLFSLQQTVSNSEKCGTLQNESNRVSCNTSFRFWRALVVTNSLSVDLSLRILAAILDRMGTSCGCFSGALERSTNMKPAVSEYIPPVPPSPIDTLYNRLPTPSSTASNCCSDVSPLNQTDYH